MTARAALTQITKVYPNGVVAARAVDFAVDAGQIHALVGENGAGKSTLMRILFGLEQPTAGEIHLRGRPVTLPSPHHAIAQGIGMVHQNFMLAPSFTVAENVVLGEEPRRWGFVDRARARAITADLARTYGLHVDPAARVEAIPVGMRQRVEILKTLYRGADLLILDEPTAVLTPQESSELFAAVRKLVQQGKSIIFITHKLEEVKAIADRVTVLRDGRVTGCMATADVTAAEIAQLMVGRASAPPVARERRPRGPVAAEVRDLSCVAATGQLLLRGLSLAIYSGEILGVAGVEGNGQTELVEVLTGLRAPAAGMVLIRGEPVTKANPRRVRARGVAHIPEDRLANGVALDASIAENLVVDRYDRRPFTRRGLLSPAVLRRHAAALMGRFAIRAAGPDAALRSLSGGNMQKVILARELSAEPALLVAAQPTRGVDFGASESLRGELLARRNAGLAVLLVSADLAEVMLLADRIAVMHRGEIVGLFANGPGLTEEELGLYMLGVKRQPPAEMAAQW